MFYHKVICLCVFLITLSACLQEDDFKTEKSSDEILVNGSKVQIEAFYDHSLDKTLEVSYVIPYKNLKSLSNVHYLDNFINIIVKIEAADRFSIPDSVGNAFGNTGLYKGGKVAQDEDEKLYRIYPKSGYPNFWSYFKNLEGVATHELAENWHGNCVNITGSSNLKDSKCTKLFTLGDDVVEASYSASIAGEFTLWSKELIVILSRCIEGNDAECKRGGGQEVKGVKYHIER